MPTPQAQGTIPRLCYNSYVQDITEKHKAKKAQVVVFRKENNKTLVLLLKTNKQRGGFWQNITGGIEPSENFTEGAERELFEETGIKAQPKEINLSFEFHDRWGKDVLEKVFYAISMTEEVVLSKEEHEDFKWLDVELITKENFKYPSNYEAFMECLNCLRK